jgi:hypothetical protein
VGVLRTILVILAIYWSIRLFTRYVLPFVLHYFVKYISRKAQENVRKGGFQDYPDEEVLKDGNVTIKKTKRASSKPNPDGVGEYVDFEEIK